MLPTWEVELVRSMYSSSSRPFSSRAIRHSSPSETLISISFGTSQLSFVSCQSWRSTSPVTRREHARGQRRTTDHGRLTRWDESFSNPLEGFGDDLAGFLAQEVHHLSFAI